MKKLLNFSVGKKIKYLFWAIALTFVFGSVANAAVQITYPVGGEKLQVGSVHRITWPPSYSGSNVGLYVSHGTDLRWIAFSIPDVGYYDWIPEQNETVKVCISTWTQGNFCTGFVDVINTSVDPVRLPLEEIAPSFFPSGIHGLFDQQTNTHYVVFRSTIKYYGGIEPNTVTVNRPFILRDGVPVEEKFYANLRVQYKNLNISNPPVVNSIPVPVNQRTIYAVEWIIPVSKVISGNYKFTTSSYNVIRNNINKTVTFNPNYSSQERYMQGDLMELTSINPTSGPETGRFTLTGRNILLSEFPKKLSIDGIVRSGFEPNNTSTNLSFIPWRLTPALGVGNHTVKIEKGNAVSNTLPFVVVAAESPVCGSQNGVAMNAPATSTTPNLCSVGTPGNIGSNATSYTWQCRSGTQVASCSAPKLLPTIRINVPNGAETYVLGSRIPATWQSTNFPVGTIISLISLRNQTTGVVYGVARDTVNDGNELVSTTGVPVGSYKMIISASVNGVTVRDESDNPFQIVSRVATVASGVTGQVGVKDGKGFMNLNEIVNVPNVVFVSASTDVQEGEGTNDDIGTFSIRFKVKASNSDVYIPASANISLYAYAVDRNGGVLGANSGVIANITNVTDDTRTTNGNFLIREGEEETIELTVNVALGNNLIAGQYRLRLGGLKWDTQDVSPLTKTLGLNPNTFKTGYVALAFGGQQNQVANIQEALKGLLERLKEALAR